MPVRIRLGYAGQLLSAYTDVATATIERMEVLSEERVRLVLQDPGAKIDKPLQPTVFSAAVPNSAAANTPLPVALGRVQWAPIVTVDAANLEYAYHDGSNGGIYEFRDQGVALTPATGFTFGSRTDACGAKRLTNPAGKQVATVRGSLKLTSLLYNFDFTQAGNWTGDNPNGWVLGFTEDASNKVTFNAGAQFLCNGAGPTVIIERGASTYGSNTSVSTGIWYWIEVAATVTSGRLEVQLGAAAATDMISSSATVGILKNTGTLRLGFYCAASSQLRLAVNKAAGVNVTVTSFKVWAATLIERLPDWLTEICVTRGGLLAADLDTAGTIATVDAAAPWTLGFWADKAVKIPDILKATMDSFAGWWFWDMSGKLKVGRLTDPASGSPVATFTDVELYGDIGVELDSGPGLSDTVAAIRNWAPHGQGELAGAALISADAGPLAAEYLAKKIGSSALAAPYARAVGAEPIETLLTSATHAQDLADAITSLYSVPRFFYRFSAFMDDVGSYTIQPGDVVTIQTDKTSRFGLAGGKKVVVTSARSRFLSNLVEFTAWG